MSTLDALYEILRRDYVIAAGSLNADTSLTSLAIDSLGLIELIFAIEDTFKVTVPDVEADMANSFGTVGELADYVDQLVALRDVAGAGESALSANATRLPAAR